MTFFESVRLQEISRVARRHLAELSLLRKPDTMTIPVAAEELGVSRQTIRHHMRAGRIPGARRIDGGRLWLLPRAEVPALKEQREKSRIQRAARAKERKERQSAKQKAR